MSNKIKFNIEFEVDGQDAERILKRLSRLNNIKATNKPSTPKKSVALTKTTSGKKRGRPPKTGIDDKTFVEIWQKSDSVKEFAHKTNMQPQSASVRASIMRKNGVPLKKFAQNVRRTK